MYIQPTKEQRSARRQKAIRVRNQKVLGLAMLVLAAISVGIEIFPGVHDGTAAVILIPLALYLILTKKEVIW